MASQIHQNKIKHNLEYANLIGSPQSNRSDKGIRGEKQNQDETSNLLVESSRNPPLSLLLH
jgi:hypothetical protein